MKVLVIGGAGYIGSVTAHKLIEQNYQVTVLDDLSTGHREFIPVKAHFVQGDAKDPASYQAILSKEKYQAIILLAAKIKVGESTDEPLLYLKNNFALTTAALDAAIKYQVPNFLFSSSGSIYGNNAVSPIKEEALADPQSVYTETKVMAEKAIGWISKLKNLNSVIFRYFNAAGAYKNSGMKGSLSHLIPIISEVVLGKREYLTVFGVDYPTDDGTCIRDYIHVEDLADAHVQALNLMIEGKIKNEVFNLGRGEGSSVLDIVKQFEKSLNVTVPYKIGERRPNNADAVTQYACADKAHRILKWRAKKSLADIIISDFNFRKTL